MLLEEWEALEQDIIDRLMATMHDRINMCIEAQGQSIRHLVRKMGHRHDGDMAHSQSEGTDDSTREIRQLETTHVGTIVKMRAKAKAKAIRENQPNPAILWVALEDPASEETSLPHHRKPARIGIMILAEEREMIPIDSWKHFSFLAEARCANGSFLE
jgi:hypothetical protein